MKRLWERIKDYFFPHYDPSFKPEEFMPRQKCYVINLRSKVLHKNPTLEVCNVDQVPAKFRVYTNLAIPKVKKCKHCFGKKA